MSPVATLFTRKGRALVPGQRSELIVVDADGAGRALVLAANEIIEAPNWTPDGNWLIFNAGGELWRTAPDGAAGPEKIDTGTIRNLNNDHCLSPDGSTLYLSNGDGHLYRMPTGGGEPVRVSNARGNGFRYYLHGVSPDGTTLAYVGVETGGGARQANIFTIPAMGGPDTKLTNVGVPNDGPEYSPDGRWIYFNSEIFSPGHAQIVRMRADGSGLEQLTFDERVNWFPHFSPNGEHVAYLSYPPGTSGHPENKDVILKLMRPDGSDARDVVRLFGGQGTINVNSWAPDSRRFAYVAYPIGA